MTRRREVLRIPRVYRRKEIAKIQIIFSETDHGDVLILKIWRAQVTPSEYIVLLKAPFLHSAMSYAFEKH